jgi:hypothetical protein
MATEVERSFVAGMANFLRRMKDVTIALRSGFPGRSVRHEVDFWNGDGPKIEFYIELATEPGMYFCWWIVVEPAEMWRVSTWLVQNAGEGEDRLAEGEFTAATTSELFSRLSDHLKIVEDFRSATAG